MGFPKAGQGKGGLGIWASWGADARMITVAAMSRRSMSPGRQSHEEDWRRGREERIRGEREDRGRKRPQEFDHNRNEQSLRVADNRSSEYHERTVERRLSSSIGAVHGSRQPVPRRGKDEVMPETSKPEIQQVYTQADTLNRNRRLFGSLMGHLGQAKQKLEQDTALLEKQSHLLQEVKEKNEQESRRAEEEARRKALEAKLNAKVAALKNLADTWKQHLESTRHFVFTVTEPRLAWLPANPNGVSRDLLEKRNDEVLLRMAERDLEDSKKIKEIHAQFAFRPSEDVPREENHFSSATPSPEQNHSPAQGEETAQIDEDHEGQSLDEDPKATEMNESERVDGAVDGADMQPV